MVKVVARNLADQNKLNEVLELYQELVMLTRQEPGCIKYELYQDEKNPSVIAMIEEWESREALEAHFKTAHFMRIVPMIKKYMLKDTDLNIYNQVI